MKSNNYQLTSFLEALAFTSNKLTGSKNQNNTLKETPALLKLKIIHNRKIKKKTYERALIELLQCNTTVDTGLKIVYEINYKDKLDQHQEKRIVVNNFRSVDLGKQEKRKIAYKNTEYIQNLYQLYRFKCE